MNLEHSRTRLRQLFSLLRAWIDSHVPLVARAQARERLRAVETAERNARTAVDVLGVWRALNALRLQAESLTDTSRIPRWAGMVELIRNEVRQWQEHLLRQRRYPSFDVSRPSPARPRGATESTASEGGALIVFLLLLAWASR